MVKPFVHLHLHTKYSLLDGACHLDQLVQRAKELGMSAIAMTDHGVMYGAVDFYKTCRKAGIKPIIGCEFYINGKVSRFDRDRGNPYYHLVLLAKDREGYHNLARLNTLAHLEGFYYKPRIDKEILRQYAGGLIGLAACIRGEVNMYLKDGNLDEAEQVALEYREILGADNFFLEMQNHGLPEQQQINDGVRKICQRTGMRAVVTNDVHYLLKEHAAAHEVMLCIQTNTVMSDPRRMKYGPSEFYFKSRAELEEAFPGEEAALDLTQEIADRCNLELEFSDQTAASFHFPDFPLPADWTGDRFEYLVHLGKDGLRRHYGLDYDNPKDDQERELIERFEFETGVIQSTGFINYFLVVSDFVKWSRNNGVPVGPGRGSGAGSLLAYTLDITQLDPLRFGLLFERFLNPERVSPPDFDIDFCQAQRDRTIEYVTEKYGKDNVAQIITYGQLGAKTVVRDIARVLEIPLSQSNAYSKLIPESPNMTLAKALKTTPEFATLCQTDPDLKRIMQYAELLEGFYRNTGVHPAGVVIGDKPLIELVPLTRDKEGHAVTQYDKNPVEEIGLLKMDFLGLKTLTVIDEAVKLVKLLHGIELDLNSPTFTRFDDAKTFEIFQRGDTVGIFQFESPGMRKTLLNLKPNRIEDIIAVTALYRPGPMDNIPHYIERKYGREKIAYQHPKLEEILAETYGIFVYQEQVQRAAQSLAGYSLGRADLLRRAMGKKRPEEMAKERPEFVAGCQSTSGMSQALANEIFSTMEQFAGYGFNKSHAAAYGVLSYQTAWLKAHYPAEFMCAQISSEMGNFDKMPGFVNAANDMGLVVLAPDINASYDRFVPEGVGIRFGLAGIKGVGEGAARAIVAAREDGGPFASLIDLCKRLDPGVANKRVLEALVKAGAMEGLGLHRARLFANIDFCVKRAADDLAEAARGQVSLFAEMGLDDGDDAAVDLEECAPWSEKERLGYERELLGIYLSGHPLKRYRKLMVALQTTTIAELQQLGQEAAESSQPMHGEVRLVGLFSNVTRRISKKNGEAWATMMLDDMAGTMEIVAYGEVYRQYAMACVPEQPVVICGSVAVRDQVVQVRANEIFLLDEALRHFCEELTVYVPVNEAATEKLPRLMELARTHPGLATLGVVLGYEQGRRVRLHAAEDFALEPVVEVVEQLEALCGKKEVVVRTREEVYHAYRPRRW